MTEPSNQQAPRCSRPPRFVWSLLGVAAVAAGCAPLAGPPPAPAAVPAHPAVVVSPSAQPAAPLSAEDRAFMRRLAVNWMYEAQVSRLAASRAVDPRVRSYANGLVREHARAGRELAALMRAKGMQVPILLPPEEASKLRQLSSLQPSADFDAGYVRVLGVEDHASAVAQLEQAQRETRDPDLTAWIGRTLPVLRGRLATAQHLAGALGGSQARAADPR